MVMSTSESDLEENDIAPSWDCRHPTPEPPTGAPAWGQTTGARQPDMTGQAPADVGKRTTPTVPTVCSLVSILRKFESRKNFAEGR